MSARATTLGGAQESRGLGCRIHPQTYRLRAGKVAEIVHRNAVFVGARLPEASTGVRNSRGQGCHDHPRRCAARAGGRAGAITTAICAHGVDVPVATGHAVALSRLRAMSTARYRDCASSACDRGARSKATRHQLAAGTGEGQRGMARRCERPADRGHIRTSPLDVPLWHRLARETGSLPGLHTRFRGRAS